MKYFTDVMNEAVRHHCIHTGSRLCKRLKLASGVTLSIQASDFHYCSPRENTGELANYAWYDEFEVGFPSEKLDGLMPYAETPEDPTGTVYGYVPKDVLEMIIFENGGVVGLDEEQ